MDSARRPNILLVMSDQHRASAMGCEGDPVVQTPNLDRLAGEGVRFRRSYCQGPLCMPARASLLTERYVRDHGVLRNDRDVPTDLPTFVQSVRDAGYHTACIGKMHLYAHGVTGPGVSGGPPRDTRQYEEKLKAHGFAEAIEAVGKHATRAIRSEYTDYLEAEGLSEQFQRWMSARRYGRGQVEIDGKMVDRLPMWHAESIPLPAEAYLDNWLGRRAVRWIDEYDASKPFFAWVGFAGPHDPWDAPQEYVSRYRDAEIPLGTLDPPELTPGSPLTPFMEGLQRFGYSDTLTDDAIREVRRYYYANVSLIDERIGDMIEALRRRGLLDSTWVIYTSDHGEMLGDHRMLTKMSFYEGAVRVPLIIRPPEAMAGRAADGLVEHVDVAATIRALTGAAALPGSEGRTLQGHFGSSVAAPVRDVVHSENFGFGMFRTRQHKLVVFEKTGQPVQLFDLDTDPDENHNVVDDPAYAGVLAELMQSHAEPFLKAVPTPGP
jgi:arylsulfatase